MEKTLINKTKSKLNAVQVLAIGFLIIILTGGIILSLPMPWTWAGVDPKPEALAAACFIYNPFVRLTTAPGYNIVYLMFKLAGNLMSNILLWFKVINRFL